MGNFYCAYKAILHEKTLISTLQYFNIYASRLILKKTEAFRLLVDLVKWQVLLNEM